MFSKKNKKVIKVDGMHCENCANRLKSSLLTIDNISKIDINLKTKEVTILSTKEIDSSTIEEKINDLGYYYMGEI